MKSSNVCLHIVRNPVTHDSRVLKETRSVHQGGLFGQVEIAGFMEPGHSETETLDDGRTIWRASLRTRGLPKDLLSQGIKYAEWFHRLVRRYRNAPLQVIHCHDLAPLPIAVRLKQLTGARLIYDAHELETETVGSGGVRQRLARRLERRLIPRADAMITVSPSIQAWYAQRYPRTAIHLVRNIPDASAEREAAVPLRAMLGVPEDALLFLYLGGLGRGRGIETALQAFQQEGVPHHILFMGSGPLADSVRSAASRDPRIHYKAPVPPKDVIAHAAGADVGVSLIEDACLNYRYCLPNKLFESLLAGLPVLASKLPDQAAVVEQYQAGWVVEPDAASVAAFLRGLTRAEGASIRQGLAERVGELSWENEAKTLTGLYEDLLQVGGGGR